MDERPLIVLCVGTYQRNEPLAELIEAVLVAAAHVTTRARVGAVVIDDNPDGRAARVAQRFAGRFEAGLDYRHLGRGNIALVRNLAITAALERGADWIVMTDDDCLPPPHWLAAYLDAHERTGALAFTANCVLRPPVGAPRWLVDQPFLTHDHWEYEEGAELPTAATNNSMVSAAWLRDHPQLRFDPGLGVLGGEDMVFFRSAVRAGLVIRFVAEAAVVGHETTERATLRYWLRRRWWFGNTRCVTALALGDTRRLRSAARGAKVVAIALATPVRHLLAGRRPQLRYALATVFEGLGLLAGAAGLRVRHH